MDWHCPGCKLALSTPAGTVKVPAHNTAAGGICPWSKREHTLFAPTRRAPEEIRKRREANEVKRRNEAAPVSDAAVDAHRAAVKAQRKQTPAKEAPPESA